MVAFLTDFVMLRVVPSILHEVLLIEVCCCGPERNDLGFETFTLCLASR